ncbi:MAG: 2TM domain-containing protein [Mycobacteriales bacterium]
MELQTLHEEDLMMSDEPVPPADDVALRERAIKQLKKKRDFQGHLLMYALVNAFLIAIWAVTDLHGFFWPIFPLLGWGIGIVANAWDVYRRDDLDEKRIRREMDRLQHKGNTPH